jgi:uncharacterized DUF497 family protein
VQILWDNDKNRKLIADRGLSMETFAALILEKKYLAILKNPSRKEQRIFIVPYLNYTYVVPFIIDSEKNIIIKTVFPSRKFHKMYGGKE